MLLLSRYEAKRLVETTSELLERVQRLEEEQAQIRTRIEGERKLRSFIMNIAAAAAQAAPQIGAAIEGFARAVRSPVPRGRAGGLVRARTAWRHLDGTFMTETRKDEACQRDYERHAAGGRARASVALRAPDGTFLPPSRE
jgi:hypothetical protein